MVKRICGIDEAGRGPLAGPVTAAAVVFGARGIGCTPADSKSLSARRRAQLEPQIRAAAVAWGIGWSWPEEIDLINIHNASLLAMQRAFTALCNSVQHYYPASQARELIAAMEVQVDGRFTPQVGCPCLAIEGGDRTVPQIQAASILAKEARDRWMRCYSREEPQYGFDRHVGYPTLHHRRMIRQHGASRIQRHSFLVREPDCVAGGITASS
ncbi:MAG: ribonuclease HII [Spirochaetaceae bacterium]|nr:MAG: ribonuclease HII [Spirochaetaceae bacterium]